MAFPLVLVLPLLGELPSCVKSEDFQADTANSPVPLAVIALDAGPTARTSTALAYLAVPAS